MPFIKIGKENSHEKTLALFLALALLLSACSIALAVDV